MKFIFHSLYQLFLAVIFIPTIFAQIGYTQKGEASYYADKFHGRMTASGEKYDKNALSAAHRTLSFQSMVKVTNLANGKSTIVRVNDRGPFKSSRVIDISYIAAKEIGMLASGVVNVKIEVVGLNGKTTKEEEKLIAKETEKQPINESKKDTITRTKEPTKDTKTKPNEHFTKAPDKKEVKTENKNEVKEPEKTISEKFLEVGLYEPSGKKIESVSWGIQIGAYSTIDNALEEVKLVNKAGYSKVYVWVYAKNKKKMVYKVIVGHYSDKITAKKNIEEIKSKGLKGNAVEYPR